MSYNDVIKSRGNSRGTKKGGDSKQMNYDEISDDFFNKIRNEKKANNPQSEYEKPQIANNMNNLTNKSMSLDLEQNNDKINNIIEQEEEENDMQINISDIVSHERDKGQGLINMNSTHQTINSMNNAGPVSNGYDLPNSPSHEQFSPRK